MKTIKTFLAIASLFSCVVSIGQTKDNPWAISLYGVKTEYLGDLRTYSDAWTTSNYMNREQNTVYNFDQLYGGGGLSVDRYLNRFFDFGIYGSFGTYGFKSNYGVDSVKTGFSTNLLNTNLHFRYKFLGQDNARLVPYFVVGGGVLAYFNNKAINKFDKNGEVLKYDRDPSLSAIVNGGLGLECKISSHFSIRYQVELGWTEHDAYDFYVRSANPDWQLQHSLGVTYSFSCKKKDTDKDGVIDKLDKCPNTPAGVIVDIKGCPLDTDGDGVPDYLDKCSNTPAGVKVDAAGCPLDTDGDGVADYLDKCPDTPAGTKVDANGCPLDTDKDGVADYLDKCPDTPVGVKVDAKGCPLDTDGDGVPDYLDKCPDVAGIVANKGCPEVKEETKKIFAQALQGIQFESAKDVIKASSNSILDKVVTVLKENPSYNLDINGHTDNKGIAAKNLALSQRRADAVKKYLTNKGIDAARLTSKGFGDTVPVADNKTPAGQAKNRRVEFKVNF